MQYSKEDIKPGFRFQVSSIWVVKLVHDDDTYDCYIEGRETQIFKNYCLKALLDRINSSYSYKVLVPNYSQSKQIVYDVY